MAQAPRINSTPSLTLPAQPPPHLPTSRETPRNAAKIHAQRRKPCYLTCLVRIAFDMKIAVFKIHRNIQCPRPLRPSPEPRRLRLETQVAYLSSQKSHFQSCCDDVHESMLYTVFPAPPDG